MAQPDHLANALECYRRHGFTEALAACLLALTAAPENPSAHFVAGLAHFALGHSEEALLSFQAAAKRVSTSSVVLHNLGVVLCALGRRDEALAAFQQASVFDPKRGRHHPPQWVPDGRGGETLDLGLAFDPSRIHTLAVRFS